MRAIKRETVFSRHDVVRQTGAELLDGKCFGWAASLAYYGAIGGVMVALLWFYVTSLAILIGAQLDATIERVTIDPRSKPKAATSCKLRRGKNAA